MPVAEVRFYREWVKRSGLVTFEVRHRESDLLICAERDLRRQAEYLLERVRTEIEEEIRRHPAFAASLTPLPIDAEATPVVKAMLKAGHAWNVGPMAAVAGAVAQAVGEGLLRRSKEVIVENGGDIWMTLSRPAKIGLYAGATSPFSHTLRLRIEGAGRAVGVCTSSGTIGHSRSFGKADAVVAIAADAAVADAAATAIGNRIRTSEDIDKAIEEERTRADLKGLLITAGKRLGCFGALELI